MLVSQEVDRESELATTCNKTAGEINTKNGGTIPCVEKEEDGLHAIHMEPGLLVIIFRPLFR